MIEGLTLLKMQMFYEKLWLARNRAKINSIFGKPLPPPGGRDNTQYLNQLFPKNKSLVFFRWRKAQSRDRGMKEKVV